MKTYPQLYQASAQGSAAGPVRVTSEELAPFDTAAPPQFDGPGGLWSPETLLIASIADCFVLTFRGVARAARLEWIGLEADVTGTLERTDGITRFTRYLTRATLLVPPAADRDKAKELLERAEKLCLVSNSLQGERLVAASVTVAAS